eukprot:scaffold1390_cov138-Cylindrotheca_fusiformis.AAC.47
MEIGVRSCIQTTRFHLAVPFISLCFRRPQSPGKPTDENYRILVAAFVVYSALAGYYAATRPVGTWRSPFSWHPLLMIVGLVGCAGISAITKKMGGYTNTKNHGIIAMFISLSYANANVDLDGDNICWRGFTKSINPSKYFELEIDTIVATKHKTGSKGFGKRYP